MNWFKIVYATGGLNSWVENGPSGSPCFYIGGNTYPVRQKIAIARFTFDKNKKAWYRDLKSLIADTKAQANLRYLGVDLSPLNSPADMGRPIKPQPQQQQYYTGYQSPTYQDTPEPGNQEPIQKTKQVDPSIWTLAKSVALYAVSAGDPVVMGLSSNKKWIWRTRTGNEGEIEPAEVAKMVQSVKNENGQPIQSANPNELFDIFYQKNPKPEYQPSQYQQAIAKTFAETDKNIMINALAGTGKSSSLNYISKMMKPGEKWLYLVFNKKNQIEATEKFPEGVTVLTSHAFLGDVLSKSSGKGMIKDTMIWGSDDDEQSGSQRIWFIIDEIMESNQEFPPKLKFAAKRVITQVSSLAKAFAINPNDQDAFQKITALIQQYQIDTDLSTEYYRSDQDYTPQLISNVIQVLQKSLPGQAGNSQYNTMRDHDDTLWYPSLFKDSLFWPKYNVVLVDEVQDFNRCQIVMLQELRKTGARIVAVGDPFQSIYLFRGADPEAFKEVENMLGTQGGGISHELPVNYRCGKKIVEYVNAKTDVHNLQAGVGFDGIVSEGGPYEAAIDDITREWKEHGKLVMPTALICLNNKPLVDAAMSFVRQDMDFEFIGRDLAKELVKQIERVTGKGDRARIIPVQNLEQFLRNYVDMLEDKWRGKISKASSLKDMKETTDSITSILNHLQTMNWVDRRMRVNIRNSSDFVMYLRQRFGGVDLANAKDRQKIQQKDPRSYVTLTTAHRSKGLEFERVAVVEPSLFFGGKDDTPLEVKQKKNAHYVALTRAMIELHVLADKKKAKTASVNWYRSLRLG